VLQCLSVLLTTCPALFTVCSIGTLFFHLPLVPFFTRCSQATFLGTDGAKRVVSIIKQPSFPLDVGSASGFLLPLSCHFSTDGIAVLCYNPRRKRCLELLCFLYYAYCLVSPSAETTTSTSTIPQQLPTAASSSAAPSSAASLSVAFAAALVPSSLTVDTLRQLLLQGLTPAAVPGQPPVLPSIAVAATSVRSAATTSPASPSTAGAAAWLGAGGRRPQAPWLLPEEELAAVCLKMRTAPSSEQAKY